MIIIYKANEIIFSFKINEPRQLGLAAKQMRQLVPRIHRVVYLNIIVGFSEVF